jgi:hypothetical protein
VEPKQLGTVFVIDGSGNADQREADKKRPIYQLDVLTGSITRPLLLEGQSALQFLTTQVDSQVVPGPILIAADVTIGLPAVPEHHRQSNIRAANALARSTSRLTPTLGPSI